MAVNRDGTKTKGGMTAADYNLPPPKPAPEGYVTRREAADMMGVSVMTFRRYENEHEIPGAKCEGEGPTARKIYPVESIDAIIIEEPKDEQQSAMSALMRETARAAREIHQSSALAIKAGVEAIQGTDPRTTALLEELSRLRSHCADLEREKLGVWDLLRTMQEAHFAEMAAASRRERDAIIASSRQEVLSDGFRYAWPGLVHRIFPSKESEKSIIGMAVAAMSKDSQTRMMALIGELPIEIQSSVGALIGDALEEQAERAEAKEKKNAPKPSGNGAS